MNQKKPEEMRDDKKNYKGNRDNYKGRNNYSGSSSNSGNSANSGNHSNSTHNSSSGNSNVIESSTNKGAGKDNFNSNQNNHGNRSFNERSGNDNSRYPSRNLPTKVKVEETYEDVKAENTRLEKEIQLMINEIKSMKL